MKYNSIENIPIWNYNKILETGDFEKYEVDPESWEKIEEEFFNQIGYSEKYFEILRLKVDLAKTKVIYYKSDNRALKTLIEVKKAKLQQAVSVEVGSTFDLMTAQVSKFMGFRIDVKEVSVLEFYNYLKLAQNGG